MSKPLAIIGVVILVVVVLVGWQIGACEVANAELQDDLIYLAAQPGAQVGLNSPSQDEEIIAKIVQKASDHGIQLTPQQITLRHSADMRSLSLAAEYDAHIGFGGLSFPIHFAPSSENRPR